MANKAKAEAKQSNRNCNSTPKSASERFNKGNKWGLKDDGKVGRGARHRKLFGRSSPTKGD